MRQLSDPNVPNVVVVEGLAGLGKTSLALASMRSERRVFGELAELSRVVGTSSPADLTYVSDAKGTDVLLDDVEPCAALLALLTCWAAEARVARLFVTTRRAFPLGSVLHARVRLGPMQTSDIARLAEVAVMRFGEIDDREAIRAAHGSPGRLLRRWVGELDPLVEDIRASEPGVRVGLAVTHHTRGPADVALEARFPSRLREGCGALVGAALSDALAEEESRRALGEAARYEEAEFVRSRSTSTLVHALEMHAEARDWTELSACLGRHVQDLARERGAAFAGVLSHASEANESFRARWRERRVALHLARGEVATASALAREADESIPLRLLRGALAVRQARIRDALEALSIPGVPTHFVEEARAWEGGRAERVGDDPELHVARALACFVDLRFADVLRALESSDARPRTRRGIRVLALVELDRLDEAAELASSLADDDFAELVHATVAWARGRVDFAVDVLGGVVLRRRLDGDLLFAGVAALLLGRALIVQGALASARDTLDEASELLREVPTFRALARAWATYARVWTFEHDVVVREASELLRDPAATARAHVVVALARGFSAALEGDAQEARARFDAVVLPEDDPAMAMDYALACAELEMLLDLGREGVVAKARRAREHFARVGRRQSEARACVASAWLLAARGRPADEALADEALARALELAETFHYPYVAQRCAVLQAKRARRAGRHDEAERVLVEAATRAETALVEGLAVRVALDGNEEWNAPAGIVRLADALVGPSGGGRLLVEGRWFPLTSKLDRVRESHAFVVDRRRGTIEHDGRTTKPRPVLVRLLCVLAERRGRFVDAETLYREVWGGANYHPLQHRNSVYVALNRLRRFFVGLGEEGEVVLTGGGGWALASSLDLVVLETP